MDLKNKLWFKRICSTCLLAENQRCDKTVAIWPTSDDLNYLFVRCEETERPTGDGWIKTFICKFTVNGCPAFPAGEGASKKKAKENAGKPVASYLLGTGPTTLVKSTVTLPGKWFMPWLNINTPAELKTKFVSIASFYG